MKTVYQHLMDQRDKCVAKALKTKDGNLKVFYANASRGFEEKARNLTLEEGNKPYGSN